ncbi:Complex I intermediate-associated protein 30, mitochondrial [Smittium mucronatum]|uniref:Complex I intermediate-associated protein 30, mitochondrial n=1 Tax=Smittium mucronatum TaxID=133383 RepID=A0A1R0H7Y0_9FUNG|nr:Complex I intermediate-associated protein 30, mitochondrial [Smittium mucronatum]
MFGSVKKRVVEMGSGLTFQNADPWLRSSEKVLFDFVKNREEIKNWSRGSDQDIGGFSSVRFENDIEGNACFHGYLSQQLPENVKVKRSGYALVQTKKGPVSLDNNGFWDTSQYRYLLIRAKLPSSNFYGNNARKFYLNIKCSSIIRQDIFQHVLRFRKFDEWEDIVIPFSNFALTSNGVILASQMDMYRQKIMSFGLSCTDGIEGNFKLLVSKMKMFNTERTDGDCDRIPVASANMWKKKDLEFI